MKYLGLAALVMMFPLMVGWIWLTATVLRWSL